MPTNRLIVKQEVATYASVLLDAVYDEGGQGAVLKVRDQLEQVAQFMRTSVDLSNILGDTGYTSEQHRSLVANMFTDLGFHRILIDVLSVMAERGDFDLVGRVWKSYVEQLESKLNINVVDVTTAVPLDDDLRQVIKEKTESDLGTKVVLREHIDKSILGGIIMSAQGKRIDASLASQLESARNVLKLSTDGGEC